MHRVTNGGGGPAHGETTCALFSYDSLDTRDESGVLLGEDLHFAFNYIKGNNGGVGETAAENTTEHALEVIRIVVHMRVRVPGDGRGDTSVPLVGRRRHVGGEFKAVRKNSVSFTKCTSPSQTVLFNINILIKFITHITSLCYLLHSFVFCRFGFN